MKRYICLALLCFFILGCEQNPYQIIKDDEGRAYRLNKKTGEMVIIEGNKLVALEPPEDKTTKAMLEKILEAPMDWPEIQMSGKELKMKLRTCWRANKLYYEFTVYPYSSLRQIFNKKQNEPYYYMNNPSFTIELSDKNGFVVKEIEVKLWDMAQIIGETLQKAELEIKSNVDCSQSEYESMSGYNVKWSLDMSLITDVQQLGTNLESSPFNTPLREENPLNKSPLSQPKTN